MLIFISIIYYPKAIDRIPCDAIVIFPIFVFLPDNITNQCKTNEKVFQIGIKDKISVIEFDHIFKIIS